ncbi:ABC transporter ATP-binding protein [Suttonella sp. R2A3]|uniref:ABC transporter ATP-binding protein n=1 Tax=Suttonella sp. R2A3 TaxID=2908648 RepID=UPI001F20F401|nr:ABC transporter ATP-binding protein [Suttonella sp. R2A3]UJF24957.1 ABC transporter ATP-binding protein [Suttonella sp. R2A3]
MTLIQANAISYRHHAKCILDDCSLSVGAQEIVALVGENGSGKTTLLQLLAGMKTPQKGTIDYRDGVAEHLAMMPDKAPIYPDWSVYEALCRLQNTYRQDSVHLDEIIELCALEKVLNQRGCALSHGYRQRLALAQVLLTSPQVLLLDEPSNGLDVAQRQAMKVLFKQIAQTSAIVLVSHDLGEVAALADRVYVLREGRCLALDLPEPRHDLQWLAFKNRHIAEQIPDAVVRDGRFIGLSAEQSMLPEGVLSVSQDYPAEALQEKIDALS